MKHFDREKIERVFAAYTEDYNPKDPKIRLKIDHTYRVADLCERIGQTVPGVDPELCWVSGMLHDIGRFEQVRRYHTFVDAQSVDHARFGADLLFREGLADRFGSFTGEELKILETAIRNHNKFRIDEEVPEEIRDYCRILRDADKIDIFRVNIDTPLEDIYNVTTEELRSGAVTEDVKQGFREKHAVLRSLKRSAVDYVVGHICLVYELEYPISVKIAKEQGYVDKLLDFRSENEDTNAWFAYMRETLWRSLET